MKLALGTSVVRLLAALALPTLLGLSCAPLPRPAPVVAPRRPPPAKPEEPPPTGKLPRDVIPLAYELELQVLPSRERFSGHTRIRVELAHPTARIWLHARGLQVRKAQVEVAGAKLAASFSQATDEGVARIDVAHPLPAGQALLDLEYDAPFDRQLSGLYTVRVDGKDYAFSQLEPISARQVFPCFDEPAFKTPFDVSLVVQADQTAISNGPEIASEPLPDGEKRVRFARTRPLPTYLLAFVVGPLDVVRTDPIDPSEVRGTPLPLRGIATAGRGPELQYALDHAAPLLLELERYFGIAFPYPKLDLIAVPDFDAGAMENAGAITFRESILMIDPVAAPEGQLRRYANIVAHEMSHHWTGDLVTMPWWNDVWLNEAFATFMAARTVAAVHPDYHADTDLMSAVVSVMDGDSRLSARNIRQPIESTHDIVNAFDGITYQKGAGVLAMFEHYLGAETFRRGVQEYLRAHADATADAADLLVSLSREAGKDVSGAVSSFLDQAGVPLLSVEPRCGKDGATLHLAQSRYLPAGSRASRQERWQIPVCARYAVHGELHESCKLLADAQTELALPEGCPEWILPNAGGVGYYRWSLPAEDLGKLRAAGFSKLTVREKLSFADSLHAGFESGALSAPSVFAALPAFAADANRSVAVAPMPLLRFARDYLLDPSERPALERFARELYAPRLKQLGWRERLTDDGDTKILRATVIWFLADTGRDPAVRARLAKLGRAYLARGADGAAPRDGLPVDLRSAAVTIAAQDGDQGVFDLLRRGLGETHDPVERDRLLGALSSVTDARSPQALALSLDPLLRVNEVFTPLHVQLGDERTREAAWAYLEQNFDALVARVSEQHAGWLPALAAPFCSTAMAERLQTFFAPKIARLTGGPRSLAATREGLELCAAEVEAQRAGTNAFFAQR